MVITEKRENKIGKIVVLSIIWNFMWNNNHYKIMHWSNNMLPNSVLDLIEMYVFIKQLSRNILSVWLSSCWVSASLFTKHLTYRAALAAMMLFVTTPLVVRYACELRYKLWRVWQTFVIQCSIIPPKKRNRHLCEQIKRMELNDTMGRYFEDTNPAEDNISQESKFYCMW